MKELVRCKSCGFIMEKGKLRGKCPACGVPDKLFEPYSEKIAPGRKLILSLDMHPILVHFPQAFTTAVLALSLFAMVVQGRTRELIVGADAVLGAVLPFTVLLAFCAGLLDGAIRFRRVTTPLLIRKIVFGSLFFVFSCGILAAVLALPFNASSTLVSLAGLSSAALGCGVYLGMMGVSLLNSKFPG
jgi:uncharacterized membrane protein